MNMFGLLHDVCNESEKPVKIQLSPPVLLWQNNLNSVLVVESWMAFVRQATGSICWIEFVCVPFTQCSNSYFLLICHWQQAMLGADRTKWVVFSLTPAVALMAAPCMFSSHNNDNNHFESGWIHIELWDHTLVCWLWNCWSSFGSFNFVLTAAVCWLLLLNVSFLHTNSLISHFESPILICSMQVRW